MAWTGGLIFLHHFIQVGPLSLVCNSQLFYPTVWSHYCIIAGNCYIGRLMTEDSFDDPAVTHPGETRWWHQQRTPANTAQGESHCSTVTQSLLASVGNWGTNTFSLDDSPWLRFYHRDCHSLSHSFSGWTTTPSFLLWQHAIKCELIHNVLCSLSKLPVSSLITGWAVVMMLPLPAWHRGREARLITFSRDRERRRIRTG